MITTSIFVTALGAVFCTIMAGINFLSADDDTGIIIANMAMAFALFICSVGLAFYECDQESAEADTSNPSFYLDIQAQCESVGGVFNKSTSSPACYLNGKRLNDNNDRSTDNSSITNNPKQESGV